jgi:hypothetical protein
LIKELGKKWLAHEAKVLRRRIRRELAARQLAKDSARRIEHRGSKRVFLITPDIDSIRRNLNFTKPTLHESVQHS